MENLETFITSKKWQFSHDRRMTYQKIRHFTYAFLFDIPKIFGVPSFPDLYRVKDFIASGYSDLDAHTKTFSSIEKQFLDRNSVPLLKHLVKLTSSFEDEFKDYVEKMSISYTEFDNQKLLDAYLKYCEVENRMSFPSWLLFVPFEEVITKTLRQVLQNELENWEAGEKIIDKISKPSKITPLDAHNKALYEAAMLPEGKRDEAINTLVQRFIHWGMYDVNYPEATRDSFVKKLADIESLNAQKLIGELEEKYIIQSQKTAEILKSWEHNSHIHTLLNLYVHYANNKDWKNYFREKSSYKLKILLTEIGERSSFSLEQVAFLTTEEIQDVLNTKMEINGDKINKRIKNSAYVFLNQKLHIITDEKVLIEIDNTLTQNKTNILTGTGAYPGKVTGVVRIVLSNNDFHTFLPNEILVTSTTRPDYVPVMQKAAAFITNEGGLLSHAAIMAREMKKPCIIGTKLATQVLKNGDMVEVDAEKGIVRIIK